MAYPAEETGTNSSMCLLLEEDDKGGNIQQVQFDRSADDVLEAAAQLMGHKECKRVRCFHLPMFDKFGFAVHMYLDLQGVEHHHPHNTNATQLFLIANLPAEPPEVQPDSIQGPALLCAEDKNGAYIDLDLAQWQKMKEMCWKIQPSAAFLK